MRALRPVMALVDEHPPPPDSFQGGLPIADIERGTMWWRIHKTLNAPVFFGPTPGDPPTYRFDAPGGEYRILYVGLTLSAANIETLLRNPRIPYVERTEIETRSASVLTNDHTLKLVDLRGAGLSRIGADNRLTTGSYEIAGQWAVALWRHRDHPDGILYRSKHDPNHICSAIFDRPRCQFSVSSTKLLMNIPHQWAPILNVHRKGIA